MGKRYYPGHNIIDRLFNIKTDLSAIGLMRDQSFPHYFCTPLNAVIFANIGVDGIHFCIVPEENDPALEHSPVYVISPMLNQSHRVAIAAEDLNTFLSLVVLTGDAAALECISYLPETKYADYLKTIPLDNPLVTKAVEALRDTFQLHDILDVYGYVRKLQENTDLSRVTFSDEYYEIIG